MREILSINQLAHLRPPALIVLAALTLTASATVNESLFKLTYDKPASKWTEALPLGNGRIGAMVFGGTADERLQINESTLWGGSPHDYTDPEAYSHLEEIRRLIFAGKVEEAEKLSETMMGKPKMLMPYQPFCDLRLHFPGHDQATEYRQLQIGDAIAETTYKIGSVSFRREVFVSYPDQVLIVRITASQPGQLNFNLSMDSPQVGTQVESTANDSLQLSGQIQPRQNPSASWTGSWNEPGMRFAAALKVLPEGGSVGSVAGRLEISGADAVTILFSSATSFRNYRDISGDALGGPTLTWSARRSIPTTPCAKGTWMIFGSCFHGSSCDWERIAPLRARTSGSRVLGKMKIPACSHSTSSSVAIC